MCGMERARRSSSVVVGEEAIVLIELEEKGKGGRFTELSRCLRVIRRILFTEQWHIYT